MSIKSARSADHVLIIEDDLSIRTLLRDVLEDDGYTVDDALGEAAICAAAGMHPVVILLDLMMPGMDGYEVGRRLRADPLAAGIPIIVMSAGSHLRAGAAQIGAETYLSKPFDLEALLSIVGTYATARLGGAGTQESLEQGEQMIDVEGLGHDCVPVLA